MVCTNVPARVKTLTLELRVSAMKTWPGASPLEGATATPKGEESWPSPKPIWPMVRCKVRVGSAAPSSYL